MRCEKWEMGCERWEVGRNEFIRRDFIKQTGILSGKSATNFISKSIYVR